MKSLSKRLRFDLSLLPDSERKRFYAFSCTKLQPAWTLLTFGMPALFVVGWLRDYSLFGAGAQSSLRLRLGLTVALLLVAAAMNLSGRRRHTEPLTVLYALLFATSIMILTVIEPAKLSLTHVTVMLTTIILLPYALRTGVAIGVILAMCVPLFVLLAYVQATKAMWLAHVLFVLTGIVIGIAQRNANLNATLKMFLHRQRLLKRLQTDSLTGLANRDGWDNVAARMHQQHGKAEKPLCVLYMDLDHFKAINDQHGHAAGDAILSKLGGVMRQHVRDEDFVARMGGEEFIVLLSNMCMEQACHVAERLRGTIESMPGEVPVTVSIGVAQVQPRESLASATHRADEALLHAKQTGRNRIVRASSVDVCTVSATR